MKKSFFVIIVFLLSFLSGLNAQNFSRIIQMQRSRMNGPDVTRVQQRLLSLGFAKTGAADGWYGPLTEGSVKTVQYYMGFSRDGRVTKAFWDMLFDSKQDSVLKNISIIAAYNTGAFIVTGKRTGPDNDFDEFVISSQNNEVKTVLFQHINNGLIVARFKIWYLTDMILMIRDIYYGDHKTYIYLKTAGGLFELTNGIQNPADIAMEGILVRAKDGLDSAGLKVQTLIPATAPANQSTPPPQPDTGQDADTNPQPATPAGQEEKRD